jgi:hypothetical protein
MQVGKQAFENPSLEGALEALGKSIARWTEQGDHPMTAIPGLSLSRRDAPTPPTSHLYEPIICLIAQGAKRVLLGDDTYVFDAHHFLITSLDLPTVVQIIHASREKPYLSLRLQLEQREMAQLYELFDVSSALPVNDRFKPITVPEAAPLARSQAADAYGAPGCGDRSVPSRLSESFPVQPRVQPPVWRAAVTRYNEFASTGYE